MQAVSCALKVQQAAVVKTTIADVPDINAESKDSKKSAEASVEDVLLDDLKTLKAKAKAGSIAAYIELAECYEFGKKGADKDEKRAVWHYQRAVYDDDGHLRKDVSNTSALRNLACFIIDGRGGCKIVPREAFTLLERAAFAGDVESMLRLSFCYSNQLGTGTQDISTLRDKANQYYQEAMELATKASANEGMSVAAAKALLCKLIDYFRTSHFGFYLQRCVRCNGVLIDTDGSVRDDVIISGGRCAVHRSCCASACEHKASSPES
jgi:hypothetical protein